MGRAGRGHVIGMLLLAAAGPAAGQGVAPAAATAAVASLRDLDCLIDPFAVVDLSTRENGTIEEMLVERGDFVEAGQVIARLDDEVEAATLDLALARTQMDAELEERENAVAFTRRELARIEELFKKKAVSLRDKDRASTEAIQAKLQLGQARQRRQIALLELARARKLLDRRVIRSPIDGVVVALLLSPGESVSDRPIAQIARIDPLNVEVIVPVSHFGAIERGMKAVIVPRYPRASAHDAVVTIVDRVVDAASDTFGVRLELPNPDRAIPAGVRCEVRFPPHP